VWPAPATAVDQAQTIPENLSREEMTNQRSFGSHASNTKGRVVHLHKCKCYIPWVGSRPSWHELTRPRSQHQWRRKGVGLLYTRTFLQATLSYKPHSEKGGRRRKGKTKKNRPGPDV